jgi:hypothetical protein
MIKKVLSREDIDYLYKQVPVSQLKKDASHITVKVHGRDICCVG